MAFKKKNTSSISVTNPEALLRDLHKKKIDGALSHQADIWRTYTEKYTSSKDVALELPTGSGKTLVGLMLAEWRRRKYGERVVYLCPTNQLVNQVVEQAEVKYGMQGFVYAFTGKKRDYDPAAKYAYTSAEAIAVTSYSALFNSNPFFENPEVIVLDDAHAAESYIASNWSVSISRSEHQVALEGLVGVLANVLSHDAIRSLTSSGEEQIISVDKIPTPEIFEYYDKIREWGDAYLSDTDQVYAWRLIREHLDACHFYFGSSKFLIRPLIPPTNIHIPFASAKQRIYMSATIGARVFKTLCQP